MARGTQHRKRRPRTNARVAPATARVGSAARPSWENQLFFGRLRRHGRWIFISLAVAFILSFVLLGVGSGSTGISDVISNLLNGSTSSGSSLSSLREATVKHPKNATDWLNYATKLEEDQQDQTAITALTHYTALRPKDQDALLELAGLYLTRANDWETLYENSAAVQEALDPGPLLSAKSTTPLGKAFSSLTDPVDSAISTEVGANTSNEYEQVIILLEDRLNVYQKLVNQNPAVAVNQYSLAQAAQDAGNNKVAIKAYQTFLKLAPSDSLAPTARQEIATLKSSSG